VRLWDADRGVELHRCDGAAKFTFGLAFSPDGSLLAAAGGDGWGPGGDTPGIVTLWDTTTGQRRREITPSKGSAVAPTFSPDGRTLATGGDPVIRLWEVATGKERHALHGHEGPVYCLAFSKDGRHLASSSQDVPVFIWDVYDLPKNGSVETSRLWEDLAAPDASKAFQAVRRLAAMPTEAAALCPAHLKPP